MTLTDEQQDMVDELRASGWAVHLVSPTELDGTYREWVETSMREAAKREIDGDWSGDNRTD